MKCVLINNLQGGEILAQEVWDKKGVRLLAAGTTYKKAYLKILESLNINHVYIEANEICNNKKEQVKVFNPEALYRQTKTLVTEQLKRFEDIGSISIYRFEGLINTVINEVMESSQIIENMYIMQRYNDYTYTHAVRVTVLAIMICSKMQISRYKTYEIAMGCMLHDLGKTKVSEEILNKPGKLTAEEFDQIRMHPIAGYNIANANKNLSGTIKKIILTHHEKLDGSGYPLGLVDEDICLGARICAVADIFDAMSSKRPYKDAVSLPESIRIMKLTMRQQLDMSICTILEDILSTNA